ncbi:F-actin-capping protein subunit alpha, partial [Dispira parvispora]
LSDAVDPADVADYAHMVVKRLGQAEKKYQLALNDAYAQLADTTFKGLRRNLPVNRCRMNWDKVQSYKLGTELSEK